MSERNLSYRQLANIIDIDNSILCRVANRELGMTYRIAYKLSKAFDMDLDEIIKVEVPKR